MSYFYRNGFLVRSIYWEFPIQERQLPLIERDIDDYIRQNGYHPASICLSIDGLNAGRVLFALGSDDGFIDPLELRTFTEVLFELEDNYSWDTLPHVGNMLHTHIFFDHFFSIRLVSLEGVRDYIAEYAVKLAIAQYDLDEFALEWMTEMLKHHIKRDLRPDELRDLKADLMEAKLTYQ